ncbi:MAG: thioredoxin fold domain-containing protein [Candidatus Marinimicrobia bacterium]|nr:thioredoxin fold domain-containing protein [Candidatus Neomarinimicrobiota bacterium]
MKFKILAMIITVLIMTQFVNAAEKAWYSYNEGMKFAEKEEKHIIIDFYADWCTWCKVMDKETFSDPQVQKYLFENFIPIKLNAENSTETVAFQGQKLTPRELTTAFRITGFPSVAFLTPKSEVITVVPGYIKKDMFMNLLQYMHKECYKSQTPFEEFLEKDCDNRSNEIHIE